MPETATSLGFVVTGGPSWRLVLDDDGSVVGDVVVGPVAEGDTDLLVTLPADDASAVLDGSLGLDVAFMRGRTKLVGSSGRFFSLLPALATEGWRAACRELVTAAS
jgi:hypothetical protein